MRQTMSIAYLQPAGNALAFICPPCGMQPAQEAGHCIQALLGHKVRNLCQLRPIVNVSVDDTGLYTKQSATSMRYSSTHAQANWRSP